MSAVKEDIIVAIFIVTAAVAGLITHLLFLVALKVKSGGYINYIVFFLSFKVS